MRAMKEHISHERLRELLDYNPEKGVFTWNETISPRARAGDPAGYLTKEGYWRITIEGCVYFAGPLAIFWMSGRYPEGHVVHLNNNWADSCWKNLREITYSDGELSQKTLRELLDYDPETEVFRWRLSINARARAGKRAGCLDTSDGWRIRINKRNYRASRLAWFWVTGEWPSREVHHINKNLSDDRWSNLRARDL
jgi:hypothetical protein